MNINDSINIPFIPYGRQSINAEDEQAVIDVLRSDYLTQGQVLPEFESCLCAITGAQFAIAFNSATSLHAACLALGLGPGDALWTSRFHSLPVLTVGCTVGPRLTSLILILIQV